MSNQTKFTSKPNQLPDLHDWATNKWLIPNHLLHNSTIKYNETFDLQVSLGAVAIGRLNQEAVGCVFVLVRDKSVLHVLFLRELNIDHSF